MMRGPRYPRCRADSSGRRDSSQSGAASSWPFDCGPCGHAQPHCAFSRRRASEQRDCRANGITPRTVALWRGRFLELGLHGLLKDAARPGRKPSISASVVSQVIEKTTQSRLVNATHWSRSTMAREVGISDSSVGRIWKANGLKPHRIDSFKVSNDPEFASKLEAIVGLYLNPPEHALVLSVDEKSQIQALDARHT